MKIQKAAGELSFGASDDIRIKRNSTTGNLDISGNNNLILDVSGVGFGNYPNFPINSLDVSGTLNMTTINIGEVNPKIYVISAQWSITNLSNTYGNFVLSSEHSNPFYEWAVGYVPNITWYGFSFTQEDESPVDVYTIKVFVNGTGSPQTIADGSTELVFTGPDNTESIYIDFVNTFTTTQGQRIRIQIKGPDTTILEEADISLFGYYTLS